MTPRERLKAVYYGDKPDCVASLADLSYWHAGNGGGKFIPGKTDGANLDKVEALLKLHHLTGSAIHVNLGSFYKVEYSGGVESVSGIQNEQFTHRFKTPLGELLEVREWSNFSFSWPITHHMVQAEEDLKIIRYIAENTHYSADWELLKRVTEMDCEFALPLVQVPYTGMGFLMSRYAGVEETVMFAMDEPDELEDTVETINESHKKVFQLLAEGPSEAMIVSDNLSADVQSPPWFGKYSEKHYRWMADTAHAYGKPLASHIDGRLRGLLKLHAEIGVDVADAVTPAPWGDLTPKECRDEAGDKLVLSGGVPPDHFNPSVPLAVFDRSVEAWLDLADRSSALIVAPGDQLPPDGDISRVTRMVEMANARVFG